MNAALTLYHIEENLAALIDTADMAEGDNQLAILDEIAQVNERAIAKRDNVIRFLQWLDLQLAGIKSETDRLKALKEHYERAQGRVESYLVSVIQQFAPEPKRGAKKLEGSIGILSIAKNPDSLAVTDEAVIPNQYKTLTITVPASEWQAFVDDLPAEQMTRFNRIAMNAKADVRVHRDEIKRDLAAGYVVPGATMKEGGYRLKVR